MAHNSQAIAAASNAANIYEDLLSCLSGNQKAKLFGQGKTKEEMIKAIKQMDSEEPIKDGKEVKGKGFAISDRLMLLQQDIENLPYGGVMSDIEHDSEVLSELECLMESVTEEEYPYAEGIKEILQNVIDEAAEKMNKTLDEISEKVVKIEEIWNS